MKKLSVKDVEYLAFTLARKALSFNEPIPDFSTRFPNILESCLATPFQTFGGKSLYAGLISKAAILFYLMIKNHPFQNGNKRIAMTTLLVFLHKNKKWLQIDTKELYKFTMFVTESSPKLKETVVAFIEQFIKEHLTGL